MIGPRHIAAEIFQDVSFDFECVYPDRGLCPQLKNNTRVSNEDIIHLC